MVGTAIAREPRPYSPLKGCWGRQKIEAWRPPSPRWEVSLAQIKKGLGFECWDRHIWKGQLSLFFRGAEECRTNFKCFYVRPEPEVELENRKWTGECVCFRPLGKKRGVTSISFSYRSAVECMWTRGEYDLNGGRVLECDKAKATWTAAFRILHHNTVQYFAIFAKIFCQFFCRRRKMKKTLWGWGTKKEREANNESKKRYPGVRSMDR